MEADPSSGTEHPATDPNDNRTFAIGILAGVLLVVLAIFAWNRLTGSEDVAAPAPTAAEVAAANTERQASLEATLVATAGDDRSWSDAMEAQLADTIASDASISPHRDLDISCAAELCRVTAVVIGAEFDPVAADGFWLPVTRAGGTEAPDALAWPTPIGNGDAEIKIWLARAGSTDVLEG